MANKTENKKCSKAVPIFFFLIGVVVCLTGAGEVGGFMIVIAFLAWCLCAMVDAGNAAPASNVPATAKSGRSPLALDDEEGCDQTMPPLSFPSIDEPVVNVDGTPMLGSFDIHGNPYGVTSHNDMR